MRRILAGFLTACFIWLMAAASAFAVEVDLQFLKGAQFFTTDGSAVLAGGKIFIQDAGTSSHRTTYSDEDGTVANTFTSNKIILDSDGRLSESVYIPTGSWKITVTDSDDVTVFTEDNIEGALDTSTFTVASAKPELPVLSKTSAYTVTTSDLGKCINANPTGGAFTITLVSAATAGDGKTLCVRHVGTANEVTIATVSNQTISGLSAGGVSRFTWILTQENQGVWLVSDGANWHIIADTWDFGQVVIPVEDDDLSTPPGSPTAGAWYIVGSSPAGDWSAFNAGDLAQSNGTGSWIDVTPQESWRVYIKDENVFAFYDGTAWQSLPTGRAPTGYISGLELDDNATDDDAVDIATGIARSSDDTADIILSTALSGKQLDAAWVAGSSAGCLDTGAYAASTWYHIFIIKNPSTGAVDALCSTQFNYSDATQPSGYTVGRRIGSVRTDGTPDILDFEMTGDTVVFDSPQLLASGAGFAVGTSASTATLTVPTGLKVEANLSVWMEGIANNEAVYIWDADLSDPTLTADQGPVFLGGAVVTSYDANGAQVNVITNASAQVDIVSSTSAGSTADIYTVGWRELRRSAGTQGPTGATGSTGATGAAGLSGLQYNFDTATDTQSDSDSGDLWWNNGTISSVTEIAFDDDDLNGTDVSAYLVTLDDSDSSVRTTIIVQAPNTLSDIAIFQLDGACTDEAGWVRCPVTHVASNGTFSEDEDVSAMFSRTGDKGDTGATGATGSTGPTVALNWNFDTTTTDSDPGSGNFRLNNATASSATEVYFDNNEAGGTDVSTYLATWDDSGASALRGQLLLIDPADSTVFHFYNVTGSVTDGTGYQKITVSHLSGNGSFTNTNPVTAMFFPRGPAGAGLADVVDDATPQLGGTLDANGNPIDMDGNSIILDADADSFIRASTDDFIEFAVAGATEVVISGPTMYPQTNDGIGLGAGTNMWSDLFLASGAVINFNNGDVALTHAANNLVLSGGSFDFNGNQVVFDADGDTHITADTDDQIDIALAGADDFQFTANTLTAVTGSAINAIDTQAIKENSVSISPIGTQTIWVPAVAMWGNTTDPAGSADRELATNDLQVKGMAFDSTADEKAQFYLTLPKSWDESTITFQVYWTTTGGGAAETVSFDLACGSYTDNDALDAALGTAITVGDTWIADDDLHVTAESGALTVANASESEFQICQLLRDISDDDLGADADVLGVKIFYTTSAARDN